MEKNNKIYKIINILLVLIWCITVFSLSNEVADTSSNTSGNVIKFALKIINPKIDNAILDEMVQMLQPIVRKMAHFTLYAVGGILIFNMLDSYTSSRIKNMAFSWVLGTFNAITDEIHQLYVAGRSGEVRDVCIDSMGVLCGVLLIYLMVVVFEKESKQKISKKTKNRV